jgi:hypothetical protein
MLTRPERWYAPAGKLLVGLAAAVLLALLFVITDSGKTAEAAGLQPVAAESNALPDLCGGYIIDGRAVHQHPCNPPVAGCFQWGCGACNWYGCAQPCYFAGCVTNCGWCGAYNCGRGCVNACNYGCGNVCNYGCGNYNPCGSRVFYGAYGFVNYSCAGNYSLRFENPPQAVFCGSNTAVTVLAPGLPNGTDILFNTSWGTIGSPVDVINGRATTTLSVPFGRTALAQLTARWDGVSTSTIIQVVC